MQIYDSVADEFVSIGFSRMTSGLSGVGPPCEDCC